MQQHEFRVVARCPVPKNIAPYISVLVTDSRAGLNSAYRGDDARALLNKYGHHSQTQLSEAWVAYRDHGLFLYGFSRQNPPNPANPPGFSTHEQKSDGVAYPLVPRGHDLAWWQLGFDVNDVDVPRVINTARRYGWLVWQPYHTGSEVHHLNFRVEPIPMSLRMSARIVALRATLPRS